MSEPNGGALLQGRGHHSRRPPSRGRGRGSLGQHGHHASAAGALVVCSATAGCPLLKAPSPVPSTPLSETSAWILDTVL